MTEERGIDARVKAAVTLYNEFIGTRDERALTRAMTELTEVIRSGAGNGQERTVAFAALGSAALEMYRLTRDPADLDTAMNSSETALESMPADSPVRPAVLSAFSGALRARFDDFGDVGALAAAVAKLREAAALTSDTDVNRPGILANLGGVLLDWYKLEPDAALLEEAVRYRRIAMELSDPQNAGFAVRVSGYAEALLARFRHASEGWDMREAVGLATRAVQLVSAAHPDGALLAYRLRDTLFETWDHMEDLSDLERLIDGLRLAISRLSPYDPARPQFLQDVVLAQYIRFKHAPSDDSPAVLIADIERLVGVLPAGSIERGDHLISAAGICSSWVESTGELAMLDVAVDLLLRAACEMAADDRRRPNLYSLLGVTLHLRFRAGQEPADLAEAIEAATVAFEEAEDEHPERIDFASRLGLLLRERYQQQGEPADLDRSIWHARNAVAWTEPTDQALAGRLSNLASGLTLRFVADRRDGDLDEAIDLSRRALMVVPADHPRRAMYFATLSIGLFERFRHTDAVIDLDASIDAADRARGCPGPAEDQVMAAHRYGIGMIERFRRSGELADIDSAITALRAAVAGSDGNGPLRIQSMEYLLVALRTRTEAADSDAGREETFKLWGDLLASAFDKGDGRAGWWVEIVERGMEENPEIWDTLATALEWRFDKDGQPDSLRTAVGFRRRDVATLLDQDPAWPLRVSRLAGTLRWWFEVNRNDADLEEAINLGRRALERVLDAEDRVWILHELGVALVIRYEHQSVIRHKHLSSSEDLDEALRMLDLAIEAAPDGMPNRELIIFERATAYQYRYQRYGDPADADIAIAVFEQSAARAPERSVERAIALCNLANVFVARAQADSASEADLRAADEATSTLVEATPPGHAIRQRVLLIRMGVLMLRLAAAPAPDADAAAELRRRSFDLAATVGDHGAGGMTELISNLHSAFDRIGDWETLEAAIKAGRQALDSLPSDHPVRPMLLTNLAASLRSRLEIAGDLADAEMAISLLQEAIAAEPAEAWHRMVLGMVMITRHIATGGWADLEAAIDAGRAALARSETRSGTRPMVECNLAYALYRRFELTHDVNDLNEAAGLAAAAAEATGSTAALNNLGLVLSGRFSLTGDLQDASSALGAIRSALERTPPGNPTRPGLLSNLADIHSSRHTLTNDPYDLDEAVRCGADAVAGTAQDHADRASFLINYGRALVARSGPGDPLDAVEAFRSAAACETAPMTTRIQAAQMWGHQAAIAEDWAEAVQGYSAAVELLPRSAPRMLSRPDQERHLAEIAGLASAAAAATLENGDPKGAVRLLEQGRGVLYAQALDTRSDLSRLEADYPELAAELTGLRGRLDPVSVTETTWEESTRRRRDADRWNELVDYVRELPGHRSFLLPPALWELTDEAKDGPLVYINVSQYRSDALAVTPGGITVVPLPNATAEMINERSALYFAALFDGAFDRESLKTANTEVIRMLGFLWDVIVGPVLAALGLDGPREEQQRIWWLPVGQLSLLPLHAAGHHDGSGRAALDRVISSYIPTVRALRHGRQQPAAPQGGALVVVMPHTPEVPDLPYAEPEADVVTGAITETLVLSGPEATRHRIITELPGYPWAHFACHGAPDMAVPSEGQLVVHDHREHPLTVLDVGNLRMAGAKLAFLSACMTAVAPAQLGDEAIHLAAAFHLAGYPHVIATAWPVWDRIALIFCELFYAEVGRGGDPVAATDAAIATAVHTSVRTLRTRFPNLPSLWAPYIHTGV